MPPNLFCRHHRDREATGRCDRCGEWLCAECLAVHRDEMSCVPFAEEPPPAGAESLDADAGAGEADPDVVVLAIVEDDADPEPMKLVGASMAELRCRNHERIEATTQCDRCGDMLCGDCERRWKREVVCPRCLIDLAPARIGADGRTACILNFVSLFVCCFILNIFALVYALRGRGVRGHRARMMLQSMAIYAALNSVVLLIAIVANVAVIALGGVVGAMPVLQMATLAIYTGGSGLAIARWLQASSGEVQPKWVKPLTVIPPILGFLWCVVQTVWSLR